MKNSLCPGILAVVLLCTGHVHAQGPTYPPAIGNGAPIIPPPVAGYDGDPIGGVPNGPQSTYPGTAQGSGPPPYRPGLNDYLVYPRPCGCCGPVGKDGPILYELYMRNGVSLPFGGGTFGKALAPGYMLQGGGRTLMFASSQSWAWTADLGVSTVWWDADKEVEVTQRNIERIVSIGGQPITTIIPELQVTPSSLHQIYVHLAGGQEFYLTPVTMGVANDFTWRIGYDAGIRWGTAKVVYRELPHGNDVVKGGFFAVHTDVEWPYKCCLFNAGFRAEIAHIRSDILQPPNGSNLSMVNILFNLGMRF